MFILAIPCEQCEYSQRNTFWQCQAAKQARSLYEFRQGRVEDLATPNYLRIFHLAVTMPRLWKVPDLKLQMVPEHMAAIGFAEHVDCLDSLLHKQLDWPDVPLWEQASQVILLGECKKHLRVCFDGMLSMFMHISHVSALQKPKDIPSFRSGS